MGSRHDPLFANPVAKAGATVVWPSRRRRAWAISFRSGHWITLPIPPSGDGDQAETRSQVSTVPAGWPGAIGIVTGPARAVGVFAMMGVRGR